MGGQISLRFQQVAPNEGEKSMSGDELSKLSDFIGCELAAGNITETTPLFSTRLISSRNLLYLICFLEDNFKIKVFPTDMTIENMDTVVAIDRFVTRKRGRMSGA